MQALEVNYNRLAEKTSMWVIMIKAYRNIITNLVFAALFAITLFGVVNLSGDIAIHFNAQGQPDNFIPLIPGLLYLPILSVVIYGFFEYLPELDPLGDNYESFEDLFEILKILIVGVMTYIQGLIVAWNLGFQYNINYMIVPVIFSVYYLSGKIMEKAEKNWFVGIRNPWTLSSDEVWKKTHEQTAPLMKASGVAALAVFLAPEYSVWIFVGPAILTVLFSTGYSYWLYQEEDRR